MKMKFNLLYEFYGSISDKSPPFFYEKMSFKKITP